MKGSIFLVLFVFMAFPVTAQQTTRPGAQDTQRDQAIKRCRENRGTNCESNDGLREWLREERPITDAERQAAAAGRRHREACAANKKGAGC